MKPIEEHFKIYVDQLRNGGVETLSEEISPEFIDVREKDLSFDDPIFLDGEAYLAEDMLVLHLNIKTFCKIPCSICNEPVKVAISVDGAYQAVDLKEIKGRVYYFREMIRELILLSVPVLAECDKGNCPKRSSLQKYLKPKNASAVSGDEGYQPFANLDIDTDQD